MQKDGEYLLDSEGSDRETSQESVYRFFSDFYITRFFVAFVVLSLILIVWVPILYIYITLHLVYASIVKTSLYITATFVLMVPLGRISNRLLKQISFYISADAVGHRGVKKTIVLPMHEIDRVAARKMPFVKGFLEIGSPHARLIVPSTIHGFADFGTTLQGKLSAIGKPELIPDEMVKKMVCMGQLSEAWNERAKQYVPHLIAITAGSLLLNFLVAARIWTVNPAALIIWCAVSLPIPILVYSIAEFRMEHAFWKSTLNNKISTETISFRSEVMISSVFVIALYGILGFIFKTLFSV